MNGSNSCFYWFAVRLMKCLAARVLTGKKMDLLHQPPSLTEYAHYITLLCKKKKLLSMCRTVVLCPLCLVVTQMSLTLEEKQRLAKEQEQAAKLRSQQPLAPQTIKPPSTSSSQVKSANISPKQRFSCHAALWREKN